MFYYNGKKIRRVGFLGLGKSNLGVLSYLSRHYSFEYTVRAASTTGLTNLSPKFSYFEENALLNIDEDILFLSPSARRDILEIENARKRGVILSSDTEFFFENSSADIYAVTGSDGKSTTTYLTSRLLKSRYRDSVCCGNIGEAMTPHLDDGNDIAYTAELSSFQLMYQKPKTKRCVITNVTKNHLNWHRDFNEYIDAKAHILENSKERIFNFDCDISRNLAKSYDVFGVFSKTYTEEQLRGLVKAEIYVTVKDGYITCTKEKLLKIDKIKVGGDYNILNFMAAIAMAHGCFKKEDVTELAENFGGLPHRCELIGEYDGVKYYDSSIDSSPQRCAATLRSMRGRVIIIIGGRSKGLDFKDLLPILEERTKLVIFTGEVGEQINDLISTKGSDLSTRSEYVKDFYEAVEYAVKNALPGDTVLLSPAATSFDCFANFEERGDAFKEHIKRLKSKG